ncbi:MAG: hypothetical protein ACOCPC_11215, partial [Segatella copri]
MPLQQHCGWISRCSLTFSGQQYFNKGIIEPSVSFWRDSAGNEVDLIYRDSDKEDAFEIKSAETFNESFLDGLKYWS